MGAEGLDYRPLVLGGGVVRSRGLGIQDGDQRNMKRRNQEGYSYSENKKGGGFARTPGIREGKGGKNESWWKQLDTATG